MWGDERRCTVNMFKRSKNAFNNFLISVSREAIVPKVTSVVTATVTAGCCYGSWHYRRNGAWGLCHDGGDVVTVGRCHGNHCHSYRRESDGLLSLGLCCFHCDFIRASVFPSIFFPSWTFPLTRSYLLLIGFYPFTYSFVMLSIFRCVSLSIPS